MGTETLSDIELTALCLLHECLSIIILPKLDNVRTSKGAQWRSWLRHCAISWEVAGSIPDGVSGIFH